jgi:hypothetical protein
VKIWGSPCLALTSELMSTHQSEVGNTSGDVARWVDCWWKILGSLAFLVIKQKYRRVIYHDFRGSRSNNKYDWHQKNTFRIKNKSLLRSKKIGIERKTETKERKKERKSSAFLPPFFTVSLLVCFFSFVLSCWYTSFPLKKPQMKSSLKPSKWNPKWNPKWNRKWNP